MLFSRSIFTLRIRIPCKRKNASILRKELKHIIICRRPESNRYGYHYPRDFKSRASASSATAARDAHTVFAKSIRALHCLFNLASMGGGGFEPPKQIAADLQSVPFGHSGIHPFCLSTISIYIINKRKAQGNLSNSPALFPNFYTQNDHAAFI